VDRQYLIMSLSPPPHMYISHVRHTHTMHKIRSSKSSPSHDREATTHDATVNINAPFSTFNNGYPSAHPLTLSFNGDNAPYAPVGHLSVHFTGSAFVRQPRRRKTAAHIHLIVTQVDCNSGETADFLYGNHAMPLLTYRAVVWLHITPAPSPNTPHTHVLRSGK
jgi:hypothetical protein